MAVECSQNANRNVVKKIDKTAIVERKCAPSGDDEETRIGHFVEQVIVAEVGLRWNGRKLGFARWLLPRFDADLMFFG